MIVGIDLGTTNSLIGHWTPEGPRLIPNALGRLLTPSVVGVGDDGHLLVGAAARERLVSHPGATCASFKRFMGSERGTRLGERSFRPEELSALVLRSLIDDITAATGQRPEEAVISVPAYFSDAQRKATRAAGELAGVRVERIVNEPTAAALAYGLQARKDQSKFLVFDLGGGTFDVSILEMFDGVMEVHASAGDNFLGGEDFVDVLCDAALADLKLDGEALSPSDHALLRSRMEVAKCTLSTARETSVAIRCGERELSWSIGADRFETLCAGLLSRMRTPVERALRDARAGADQLDEIVLVGGASRMPMVSRLVARLFGRLPLRHIDPDQTIAVGAVVMSGMKQRDEAFREIVMTDVCPYTLGVEVSTRDVHGNLRDGAFSPIIERNTVIPTSRVERYFPITDFQRQLNLRVYQGESPRTANNVYLGELSLSLPPKAASELPVDVRFTYDVNGLLEVEAHVVPTDERHRVVIERTPGVLSPEDIARRFAELSALKVHPRDVQANLALMGRAERLFEENLGDVRRLIGEWLTLFQTELDSQDAARIERARRALSMRLDEVDRSPLPGA